VTSIAKTIAWVTSNAGTTTVGMKYAAPS